MLILSGKIVENIEEKQIERFLKGKGYVRSEEEKGKKVEYWINDLIEQKELDVEELEDFLYEELFFGKRKSVRFYQLGSLNKIKDPDEWIKKLADKCQINTLDYKEILISIPSPADPEQIAAITVDIDYKGNVSNLKMLFVAYAEVEEQGKRKSTCAYYPVEIDLVNEMMNIKAWNRQALVEGYKIEEKMDHIIRLLSNSYNVKTKSYMSKHKKILHNMSQGIVTGLYEKIPAFNQIEDLEENVYNFEQDVLKVLSLSNIEKEEKEYFIPKKVFDFEDEMKKMLEKLCISDYFYDKPYEKVWNMGVDMIVSKIKFQDMEHVLTILSGESSEMPIFCTRTFLSLKKSLEDAKLVDRLWVQRKRMCGKLHLSYNATRDEFLGIKILSDHHFVEKDLLMAEEIYRLYEERRIGEAEESSERNIV